jgi:hypothetical protein
VLDRAGLNADARSVDDEVMGLPSRCAARCTGFVLGAVLVVLLLAAWRVPGGHAAPAAEISVTVNRTGELDVRPHGRLTANDLLPGQFAAADFVVTNTTGTARAVRVRARAPAADLDEQLAICVVASNRSLFAGTLAGLRAPTSRRIVLAAGARAPVVVWIWLPTRARAYRARVADISLELVSEAVR